MCIQKVAHRNVTSVFSDMIRLVIALRRADINGPAHTG